MFSENIKKLRENAGLTQDEFAEKIFVTRTAVSKWENGKSYPSIDSLKEISELFGVSIDTLISDDELENFNVILRKKPQTIKEFLTFLLSDMWLILKSNWMQCVVVVLFAVPLLSRILLDNPINYFENLVNKPFILILLIYSSIKMMRLRIQVQLNAPITSAIIFSTVLVLIYYIFLYVVSTI